MKNQAQKLFIALTLLTSLMLVSTTARADCATPAKLKSQAWLLEDGDQGGPTVVGFWRVTLTSKGNTAFGIPDGAVLDKGFAQWHNDGTEIMNSNRQPLTGSFCLGVWKKVGPFSYKLNHFAMGFDDGVHQSYANIREDVTLSLDGDSFSGTFAIANYDLQGNPGPVITGEIRATRVKINTTIQDVL
jgi:hypothetical protein